MLKLIENPAEARALGYLINKVESANLHNVSSEFVAKQGTGSVAPDPIAKLILSASNAVNTYRNALLESERNNRTSQHEALSALYSLHCCFLRFPDRREAFFAEKNITVTTQSKYPALPLIKWFIARGEPCPELQTKSTYWAGAIEAGVLNEIPAPQFTHFIESTPGGVHGAYKIAASWLKKRVDPFDEAKAKLRLIKDFHAWNTPTPIETTELTRKLNPGLYPSLIQVRSDGTTALVACTDTNPVSGERALDAYLDKWTTEQPSGIPSEKRFTAKRRHDKAMSRSKPIVLADDDPAMLEMRSRFPNLVRVPKPNELVLKSGEHNRKIGSHVETNKWYGFPIFTLTLPERTTCPKTCPLLKSCYANGMSQSTNIRYQPGPELTEALYRQLTILSADPKSRNGFVVRLHVLGDFPDQEYLNQWIAWLEEFPALNIFGFTSWQSDTELGAAIHNYSKANWDRFAIRTSDQTGEYGSTVLSNDDAEQFDGDGIVCAAERKVQKCCGNCGYCWSTTKPVAFINH